ncbi:MAG: M23 family metallopeptidase [Demequinaceae bacterium]|nr:M23 family metallopeptidase [Demequinaceae bacterium]
METPHRYDSEAPAHPPTRSSHVSHGRLLRGVFAALALISMGAFVAARPADAALGRTPLSAPVAPFHVERLAALPQKPWLSGHRGLDLQASAGAVVASPGAGVVTYVGFVVDRPVLSIRHEQGLTSSFEPVDSRVAVGDVVGTGEVVGTVAEAPRHCAQSQCVHWGLRLDGAYVDPLDYLEGFGTIRLLPAGGG